MIKTQTVKGDLFQKTTCVSIKLWMCDKGQVGGQCTCRVALNHTRYLKLLSKNTSTLCSLCKPLHKGGIHRFIYKQ